MIPFFASDLEIIVIKWLEKNKIRYRFQTSLMGGFYQLGGAVVDFIIEDGNLAWRVMGEYWHEGVEARGRDTIQREMLTAMGFVVVDIYGEDLRKRLNVTLRKALRGEEMPRGG